LYRHAFSVRFSVTHWYIRFKENENTQKFTDIPRPPRAVSLALVGFSYLQARMQAFFFTATNCYGAFRLSTTAPRTLRMILSPLSQSIDSFLVSRKTVELVPHVWLPSEDRLEIIDVYPPLSLYLPQEIVFYRRLRVATDPPPHLDLLVPRSPRLPHFNAHPSNTPASRSTRQATAVLRFCPPPFFLFLSLVPWNQALGKPPPVMHITGCPPFYEAPWS